MSCLLSFLICCLLISDFYICIVLGAWLLFLCLGLPLSVITYAYPFSFFKYLFFCMLSFLVITFLDTAILSCIPFSFFPSESNHLFCMTSQLFLTNKLIIRRLDVRKSVNLFGVFIPLLKLVFNLFDLQRVVRRRSHSKTGESIVASLLILR